MECGVQEFGSTFAGRRNPAVFTIIFLSCILLWLPPLPFTIRAADFPSFLLDILRIFKTVKLTETWPLRWDYLFFPLFFLYALGITWKSGINLREAGFGASHFVDAFKYLIWPTLLGALFLLGIGWANGSIDITLRFWKRLNPLAGLLQQVVLQIFFHRQLFSWFGMGRKTALILAFLFMVLHAPNPGLMLGTLFGMYFWARCYQKHPNLYALALSHAFLSALLMHTMPKWLLPSVSVGQRFIEKGIIQGWWK